MTSPLIRSSLSVVEWRHGHCVWLCVGVCVLFISAGEHLPLLQGCNYRPVSHSDTLPLPVRATASGVKVSAERCADLLTPHNWPGCLSSCYVVLFCFFVCLFTQTRHSSKKPPSIHQCIYNSQNVSTLNNSNIFKLLGDWVSLEQWWRTLIVPSKHWFGDLQVKRHLHGLKQRHDYG